MSSEKKYLIGINLITAEPQAHFETGEPGYKVTYIDGYVSWAPASVIAQRYFELETRPDEVDVENLSILETDVENFVCLVRDTETNMYHPTEGYEKKISLLEVMTRHGYVHTEASSSVNIKTFSHEIGKSVCAGRIRPKLWEFLGGVLQWAINGVNRPKVDNLPE
jgi:hypothetical protein